MAALAKFVQQNIRYVAIELGVGRRPGRTAAVDIFHHRYGDCKDKATLMGTMLNEIGIDSYYCDYQFRARVPSVRTLRANSRVRSCHHRDIKLPDSANDPSLVAVVCSTRNWARILFFRSDDDMTPFGRLRGALQDNFGLLVAPDGGELYNLPMLPAALTGV